MLSVSHMNTASGLDYTASTDPSPLTFMAGATVTNNASTSTSECFTISITDDILDEGTEIFQLGLASSSSLIVIDTNRADSEALVVIIDNDIGEQHTSIISSGYA